MTITVYTFEDKAGVEQSFSTMDSDEAQLHAREHNFRCMANEYELRDTEIAWDFTLGGEDSDAETVTCKLCKEQVDADTAHRHQGEYVGDECCWDDRLRGTE